MEGRRFYLGRRRGWPVFSGFDAWGDPADATFVAVLHGVGYVEDGLLDLHDRPDIDGLGPSSAWNAARAGMFGLSVVPYEGEREPPGPASTGDGGREGEGGREGRVAYRPRPSPGGPRRRATPAGRDGLEANLVQVTRRAVQSVAAIR